MVLRQDILIPVYLHDGVQGGNVRIEIKPRSINTIVYSDLTSAGSSDGSVLSINLLFLLVSLLSVYFCVPNVAAALLQ